MKILLLEDEIMLQSAIAEYLEEFGYIVTAFENGEEAYKSIIENSYDLFIFDINVPSIDGLTLLETLQEEKLFIPTIFISAITKIEQISKAYQLGCYDYLKKPFHLKELLLHIERLLQIVDIRAKEYIKISKYYSYDLKTERLFFDGEEQQLTLKQSQIIHLLVQHINRVVDFGMLHHYVWHDTSVTNATMRAEVHRVKKSLKEDFIENIKGIGYSLRQKR